MPDVKRILSVNKQKASYFLKKLKSGGGKAPLIGHEEVPCDKAISP